MQLKLYWCRRRSLSDKLNTLQCAHVCLQARHRPPSPVSEACPAPAPSVRTTPLTSRTMAPGAHIRREPPAPGASPRPGRLPSVDRAPSASTISRWPGGCLQQVTNQLIAFAASIVPSGLNSCCQHFLSLFSLLDNLVLEHVFHLNFIQILVFLHLFGLLYCMLKSVKIEKMLAVC